MLPPSPSPTPSNYSATPTVTYHYDNLTNAKGKLIKVESSVSTTEYSSFDILGRVTASKQTTNGVTYGDGSATSAMTYSYNLSGALIEQQYPSGQKVKNTIDANGDLSMVQSRKSSTSGYWSYANSFTYNAAGAVTSMQLGNGRWESTTFNERLQPVQIALGTTSGAANLLDLDYTYGTTANNGNVLSQTITVPTVGASTGFTAVQTYNYDSVNRLKDATENITPHGGSQTQSWKQVFSFDRYGNRNFVTGSGQTTTLGSCPTAVCNPSIDPSNNRLTSSTYGYNFDSAGNTTRDASDRKFTYDAENKQTKVESLTTGTNTVTGTVGEYSYDGDGKRVKKYVPSTGETTVFVYDAAGKLIEEYSTIVETTNAKLAYVTNDHLGSPRINTDANGAITARHDYHPFGEEIATSHRTSGLSYTGDAVRKQFTGYERDSESSLDFAQARYFAKTLGRFMSVDPLNESGHTGNPQTMNRYAYVTNNALNAVDPSGMSACSAEYSYEACGGNGAFGNGDEFGDNAAYDDQTLGDGNSQLQQTVSLHLERISNSQAGNGFVSNSEVETDAVVAMFQIFYGTYDEDNPQSANPNFRPGAVTVYQFLDSYSRAANIVRDIGGALQDNAIPGYSWFTNKISQTL